MFSSSFLFRWVHCIFLFSHTHNLSLSSPLLSSPLLSSPLLSSPLLSSLLSSPLLSSPLLSSPLLSSPLLSSPLLSLTHSHSLSSVSFSLPPISLSGVEYYSLLVWQPKCMQYMRTVIITAYIHLYMHYCNYSSKHFRDITKPAILMKWNQCMCTQHVVFA